MPPCAHTECDRSTGTIKNKSTFPPASAILMTAASPASPPPTTMILGVAAMCSSFSTLTLLKAKLRTCCSSRLQIQFRKRSNQVDRAYRTDRCLLLLYSDRTDHSAASVG